MTRNPATTTMAVPTPKPPNEPHESLAGDAELAFAGVARQAELLRAGDISARELVEVYLARIHRLDPQLNTFRVVLHEEALLAADGAQRRIDAGEEAALLGVPIAIKDDTDVAGVSTMCGTGIDAGPASGDCAAVRRLREAGAIVIGKTHLPEFGAYPMCESATWGATRNPWALDRTTGGSSGGSAAAVAAGLIPAALGSDGGGSVRIPAACCGVVGFKPERGRVSTLQAPERDYQWHGLTALGPLTRSLLDSAILVDAMAGPEAGDKVVAAVPLTASLAEAVREQPRKLRIAVSFKPVIPGVRVQDAARRPVEEVADLLRDLGHEVQEHDPAHPLAGVLGYLALFMHKLPREVERLPNPRRLERRLRSQVRTSRLMPDALGDRALAARPAMTARMLQLFDEFDVLLTPVIAKPPPELGHWEGLGPNRSLARLLPFVAFTPVQNYTGQPAISIPAGLADDGVPRAIHLAGRPGDEEALLSLAAQIEAERPWAHLRPPLVGESLEAVSA